MFFHSCELLVIELARLVQYYFGDADLAAVMEPASVFDIFLHDIGQVHAIGQH